MTRSLFYIVVLGLIVFGCFIGYLSIPTHEEITLMYLERGEFEKAYSRLQMLYAEDSDNISAIMPMSMIHLNRAEIPQAIKIFESAVSRDPDSLNIRMGMTKLYKDTDRIREYVESLYIQYHMSPSAIVAHELASWLYSLGREDQEYTILKSIFANYSLDTSEYIRIGYLSAVNQNHELISELLLSLIDVDEESPKVDDSVIQYYIGMAFNFNEYEKGDKLAYEFFLSSPSPERLEILVWSYLAHKRDFPIKRYLSLLSEEDLIVEKTLSVEFELLMGLEKNSEAYNFLSNLYVNNLLPEKMKGKLLLLALEYELSFDLLESIFQEITFTELDHAVILNFVENTIDKKNSRLLDLIENNISQEYRAAHPELSLAFSITKASKDKSIDHLLKKYELTDDQEFYTTKILLKNNRTEEALKLIKKVEQLEEMSSQELYTYTNMLSSLNLDEFGIESLNKIKDSIPNESFEKAMVVFETSKGNTREVLNWVKKNEDISNYILKDLFSIADKNKHQMLALELALVLNSNEETPKNKHLLAIALAKIGQLQTATTMIKKLSSEDKTLKDEELLVLGLAGENSSYKEPYESLLEEVVESRKIPQKELREVGFQLLNSDAKESAAKIFTHLSKGKRYKSDDVQGLLGSWGKNLTPERVEWIQKRALEAKSEEQYLWLRHLMWNERGKEVYSFVQDHISELQFEENKDLETVYVESAIQSKIKEGMITHVYHLAENENDINKLKKIAEYAKYFGDSLFALEVFHQILNQDPNDYKAIKDIALLYFSMGVYDKAQCYLKKAMTFKEADYLIYFYYGETQLIEQRYRCANANFYKALGKLATLEEKKPEDIAIEGGIYYRLGYYYIALHKYNQAIEADPDNEFIDFERTNVLIDLECFCYVKKILWNSQLAKNIEEDIREKEGEWISLQVSRLQYLKRVYRFRHAKAIACKLLSAFPDKTSTLTAAADLMSILNKKQKALKYISKAKCVEPYNQSLRTMEKEVLKTYLPNAAWGRESKVTDDVGDEEIYRLFLASPFSRKDLRCDLLIEVDHFDLLAKLDIESGASIPLKGTRERFSIGFLHPFQNGLELAARMYYSNPNVGFEAIANYLDNYGGWDFILAYNKPEWDFLQTLVDRGTANRLELRRTLRLYPRSLIQTRILCNQFHLQILKNAAAYTLFDFRLDTQLNNPHHWLSKCVLGRDTLLNWSVLYEYERPHHSRSFNTIFGVDIIPIALEERSTIRNALYYQKEIDHKFTIRGHYGYLYNFKTLEWSSYYGGGFFMKIPNKLHFDVFYEFIPAGGSSTTANATKKIFVQVRGNY